MVEFLAFAKAQILKTFADNTCDGSAKTYWLTYSAVYAFDRTKPFTSIPVLFNDDGIEHMNHTYKGEELSIHHLKARMRVNRVITPFEQKDVVTIDYHSFYKSACEGPT